MSDFWEVRAASSMGLIFNGVDRRDIDDDVMDIITCLAREFGGGVIRLWHHRGICFDTVGVIVRFEWGRNDDPNRIYASVWFDEQNRHTWSNPPNETHNEVFARHLSKMVYGALNHRCERNEQPDGADKHG